MDGTNRSNGDFERGVTRIVDQAVAQGLPRKCNDPATMARIAAVIGPITIAKRKDRQRTNAAGLSRKEVARTSGRSRTAA